MSKRDNIYPNEWNALDIDTKAKLRELFSIKKSGPTEVLNGKIVISDGTTAKDLLVLDRENLSEYLGLSPEEREAQHIEDIWEAVVARVMEPEDNRDTTIKVGEKPQEEVTDEVLTEDMSPSPAPTPSTEESVPETPQTFSIGKPCCGSIGIRHKKVCVNYK